MKVSRKKFVLVFLVSAFVFQFISNSVLGPQVSLFPKNGDYFPGIDSPVAWKNILAKILYPIKFVLLRPFSNFLNDPDGPPPVKLVAFGAYWSVLALILHFLLSKIFVRKKHAV